VSVDDYAIACSCIDWYKAFIVRYSARFECKDLGVLKLYNGIKITHGKNQICMSQTREITDLLERFNMTTCNGVRTPMETAFDTSAVPKSDDHVNPNFDMASAIGSLLWLARMTRPDILYAVIVLASFTKFFTDVHVTAVKRIMRYLKLTIDYGLHVTQSSFFNGSTLKVVQYSDADWGGDLATRRSTSGAVLFLLGSFISCTCRRQDLVAISTAESELYAFTEATKDWKAYFNLCSEICNLSKHIELNIPLPSPLLCDNTAAQFIAGNRVNNNRTRHIDMRDMRIRDLVDGKEIVIEHVPSEDNVSDIFTKALPYDLFQKHRESLTVVDINVLIGDNEIHL